MVKNDRNNPTLIQNASNNSNFSIQDFLAAQKLHFPCNLSKKASNKQIFSINNSKCEQQFKFQHLRFSSCPEAAFSLQFIQKSEQQVNFQYQQQFSCQKCAFYTFAFFNTARDNPFFSILEFCVKITSLHLKILLVLYNYMISQFLFAIFKFVFFFALGVI
eukprot:TRINITY_DN7689_c0_g2_i10.p4 TRINITY_DN7689_c0_g2~~TRINITY_DN7689_c0_g2_i10.p4  ORF type:complete len:161 (+),score=0.08 TRINITY_DN7689_c0_g2_i10:207-689(+)